MSRRCAGLHPMIESMLSDRVVVPRLSRRMPGHAVDDLKKLVAERRAVLVIGSGVSIAATGGAPAGGRGAAGTGWQRSERGWMSWSEVGDGPEPRGAFPVGLQPFQG